MTAVVNARSQLVDEQHASRSFPHDKHLDRQDTDIVQFPCDRFGIGFAAGVDCDVAVETRPARLGLLRTRGATEPPDGCPPLLRGVGAKADSHGDSTGVLSI